MSAFNPIHATMCLPPDCAKWNDFDWSPIRKVNERRRANPKVARSKPKKHRSSQQETAEHMEELPLTRQRESTIRTAQ
jgi:hypothetical protein